MDDISIKNGKYFLNLPFYGGIRYSLQNPCLIEYSPIPDIFYISHFNSVLAKNSLFL